MEQNRRLGERKEHNTALIVLMLLVIIAGAMAIWFFVGGSKQVVYIKSMNESQNLFEQGDYYGALQKVDAALEKQPDSVEALEHKSVILQVLDQPEEEKKTLVLLKSLTGKEAYQSRIDELTIEIEAGGKIKALEAQYPEEFTEMTGSWDNNGLTMFYLNPAERIFKYKSGNQLIDFSHNLVLERSEDRVYTLSSPGDDIVFELSIDPRSTEYIILNGQVYQKQSTDNIY